MNRRTFTKQLKTDTYLYNTNNDVKTSAFDIQAAYGKFININPPRQVHKRLAKSTKTEDIGV